MAPNLDMRWQDQNVVKKDGQWTIDGRPVPTVSLISQHSPSNIPDHYIVGLKVTCPPGGASPPHTHAGAAVTATMVRGAMVNQMVCPAHVDAEGEDSQGTGANVYREGMTWYEPPGCHHVRSENADGKEGEEAVFVAWLVVEKEVVDESEKGIGVLVLFDAEAEERRLQSR